MLATFRKTGYHDAIELSNDGPHIRPHIFATPGDQTDITQHFFLKRSTEKTGSTSRDTLKVTFNPKVPGSRPGRPTNVHVLIRFLLDKGPSRPALQNFDTCLTDLQDLLDTKPPLSLARYEREVAQCFGSQAKWSSVTTPCLGVIRDGYPAQILPPDRHEDAVRLLRHALKRRRHRVTFRLITEL